MGDGQKIMVVEKVDPTKLRERVQQTTHKKVDIIFQQHPKKDGGVDSNLKSDQKNPNENEPKKDGGDSNAKFDKKNIKEKELPMTKTVYKVALHCDGCLERIYKMIVKAKGYADISIDKEKDLVVVSDPINAKTCS